MFWTFWSILGTGPAERWPAAQFAVFSLPWQAVVA